MRLLIFFALIPMYCFSQNEMPDTTITLSTYTSYFNEEIKEPIFVTYQIFQAGGKCDRNEEGFHFTNDAPMQTATPKDYYKSGYDEGHLANAADFSGDCTEEESTFRFYNCLPQTGKLNRGIWKSWETSIRKESQSDSLFIIAGGVNYKQTKTLKGSLYVPKYCWKIVQSLTDNTIIHVIYCTNEDAPKCEEQTITTLYTEIPAIAKEVKKLLK